MDVVYRLSQATAREVRDRLKAAPSYSTGRGLLKILEEKGHLTHRKDGRRYVFVPTIARSSAGKRAVRRAVETFFDGSVAKTVEALLDVNMRGLSRKEHEHLAELIKNARREGR